MWWGYKYYFASVFIQQSRKYNLHQDERRIT